MNIDRQAYMKELINNLNLMMETSWIKRQKKNIYEAIACK